MATIIWAILFLLSLLASVYVIEIIDEIPDHEDWD